MSYYLANQSNSKLIIVDQEDVLWAAAFSWHINTLGPYRLIEDGQRAYLSQLIGLLVWPPRVNLGNPTLLRVGQIVYKDGNIYNNQRANLVHLEFTKEQDKRLLKGYKSGYRGVTWVSSRSRWLTQVYVGQLRVHHKYHLSELEAALDYNKVAKVYGKPLNELAT